MQNKLILQDYRTVAELIKAYDGIVRVERKGNDYVGVYWEVEISKECGECQRINTHSSSCVAVE